MANIENIYQVCPYCDGEGVLSVNDEAYDPGPPESPACNWCNGTGELLWGFIRREEVLE